MGVDPLLPKLLPFTVTRVRPRHDKEAAGGSWSFRLTEQPPITVKRGSLFQNRCCSQTPSADHHPLPEQTLGQLLASRCPFSV